MIMNEMLSFSVKLSEEETMFILIEAWLHPSIRHLHLVFLVFEGQMLPLEASLRSQNQKNIHRMPSRRID